MRVLVCGGRDTTWTYPAFVHEMFNQLEIYSHTEVTIIHGCARGIDWYARCFAKDFSCNEERYPADWKTHGKAAGPIRNKQMLAEGKPDLVIAFPGGSGTSNMVHQATKAGVKVIHVSENLDRLHMEA